MWCLLFAQAVTAIDDVSITGNNGAKALSLTSALPVSFLFSSRSTVSVHGMHRLVWTFTPDEFH